MVYDNINVMIVCISRITPPLKPLGVLFFNQPPLGGLGTMVAGRHQTAPAVGGRQIELAVADGRQIALVVAGGYHGGAAKQLSEFTSEPIPYSRFLSRFSEQKQEV